MSAEDKRDVTAAAVARYDLLMTRGLLERRRAEREALRIEIKWLVETEALLTRVVAMFDKADATPPDVEHVHRSHGPTDDICCDCGADL